MAAYYKEGKKLPYTEWTEEAKEKHKAYRKKYLEENPEKAKEYADRSYEKHKEKKKQYAREKKFRKRQENPLKEHLLSIKSRAKRKGLEFTLKESDVVVPEVCPVFGFPIKWNVGSKQVKQNSCSIDRIDPTKGYTPENTQVLSNLANAMKQNANKEQLIMFARWVLKTFPEEQDGER